MAAQGTIVITGASTGIGEGCAVGLAKRGYTVYAGVRKEADGDALVKQAGENLRPLIIDVTKSDQIAAARDRVERELDGAPLDALFNNAGISVNAPLEFVPLDDLRWQLEVNVVAQVAVTQAFLPLLRKGPGRIINTGSVGGFSTTPVLGPYCASKYAMEAVSDAFRRELRPWGIHVALLEPASIRTKIFEKGKADNEEFIKNAPPELMELYGGLVQSIQKLVPVMEKQAQPPEVVLEAVIHALESPSPKTRYIMGGGANQRRFLRRMPDKLQDRMLAKTLRWG